MFTLYKYIFKHITKGYNAIFFPLRISRIETFTST